jgi:mRNA interferase MazF
MSASPPPRPLAIGEVILVELPTLTPRGVELQGIHPAVVVGFPSLMGPMRFPLLMIVPMTSDKGYAWTQANPAAYPIYAAGTARLRLDTVALIDQVRAVDPARLKGRLGTLNAAQYAPIKAGLHTTFGF